MSHRERYVAVTAHGPVLTTQKVSMSRVTVPYPQSTERDLLALLLRELDGQGLSEGFSSFNLFEVRALHPRCHWLRRKVLILG